MMEMKITAQKTVGFYTKAAATFLRGTTDKPPVPELQVSALGNAIPAAITVVTRMEKELGIVSQVQTKYVDMDTGKGTAGCPQLVVMIKNTEENMKAAPAS